MKKISVLLVCLMMGVLMPSTHAQLFKTKKNSVQQRLIEQLIMNSVVVVDNSYQLYDITRNIAVGGDDCDIYGHVFSIGVIAHDALVVPRSYVEPWDFDTNYAPRKNCEPRCVKTKVRNLSDTFYENLPYEDACAMGNDRILYRTFFSAEHGFKLDATPGIKQGIYVLLSATKPLAENPRENISCIVVERDFELKEGKRIYEMDVPPPMDILVGGMYLVPIIDDYGILTFRLVGMLEMVDGNWSLVTVTND